MLIALTLCFFRCPERAFREARRVLVPTGRLVVGLLDPTSPPGRRYRNRSHGPFYEGAELRAPDEVEGLLRSADFRPLRRVQTVSGLPDELEAPEDPRGGTGDGLFAVVEAAAP